MKIETINKKNVREFRIRFYGEKQCKLFDEYRIKKKMFNLGKKMSEKEYLNKIFVNNLIPLMQNDILVDTKNVIEDALNELLKKLFNKYMNNLVSLVQFKTDEIIDNQIDIAKLQTFLNKVYILSNNLSMKEFEDIKDKKFELPSWTKLRHEKE